MLPWQRVGDADHDPQPLPLLLCRLAGREAVYCIAHHAAVNSLCFVSEEVLIRLSQRKAGSLFARAVSPVRRSAGSDGGLALWRCTRARPQLLSRASSGVFAVNAIATTESGTAAAVASDDGELRVFDLSRGVLESPAGRSHEHGSGVACCAFAHAASGTLPLLAAGDASRVLVWDPSCPRPAASLPLLRPRSVSWSSADIHARLLLTACAAGVRLWDLRACGTPLQQLQQQQQPAPGAQELGGLWARLNSEGEAPTLPPPPPVALQSFRAPGGPLPSAYCTSAATFRPRFSGHPSATAVCCALFAGPHHRESVVTADDAGRLRAWGVASGAGLRALADPAGGWEAAAGCGVVGGGGGGGPLPAPAAALRRIVVGALQCGGVALWDLEAPPLAEGPGAGLALSPAVVWRDAAAARERRAGSGSSSGRTPTAVAVAPGATAVAVGDAAGGLALRCIT